jgi:biopolymer transport protein ExbB/TolQ
VSDIVKKLKSRKFWLGLLGTVSPIALQAITGQIGWQMAAGMSTAALITTIMGLAHVDAATAKAIAQLGEKSVESLISEVGKKG